MFIMAGELFSNEIINRQLINQIDRIDHLEFIILNLYIRLITTNSFTTNIKIVFVLKVLMSKNMLYVI